MATFIKTTGILLLLFCIQQSQAQHVLFSENFETQTMGSAWQQVSGNWHIGDVQEMRIAPAEGGRQYVLCSDEAGYMRLMLDIPDSLKATQVKLSFAYYSYKGNPGVTIETEFQKKGWKDGLRGKPWKANLPVKGGQWSYFQKTFTIPKEGNMIWITLSKAEVPATKASKPICFDAVLLTTVKPPVQKATKH